MPTFATRKVQLADAINRVTVALRDMRQFRNGERRAHVRRAIIHARHCQVWLAQAAFAEAEANAIAMLRRAA